MPSGIVPAAQQAVVSLSEEGGALDALAAAQQAVEGRELFGPAADRLRSVVSRADRHRGVSCGPRRADRGGPGTSGAAAAPTPAPAWTCGASTAPPATGSGRAHWPTCIAYADEARERLADPAEPRRAGGRSGTRSCAGRRGRARCRGIGRAGAAARRSPLGRARCRPISGSWPCHEREMAIDVGGDGSGRRRGVPPRRESRVAGAALDEGRVRRRAGPCDAGPAPGAHRGAAHPGLRRGRCRHRR